jgi:hypothetical protein
MVYYKETEKYQAKSISVKLNDDGGVLAVLTQEAKNVYVFAGRHVLVRLQRRLAHLLDE